MGFFFFFLKFLKQVHWLISSALISSKWRLSLWTSRSFLESCLVLATCKNTVQIWQLLAFVFLFFLNIWRSFKENSPKALCWIRQPFFLVFFCRQVAKIRHKTKHLLQVRKALNRPTKNKNFVLQTLAAFFIFANLNYSRQKRTV